MCRSIIEGGRRCTHSVYGRNHTNLKAREQYYKRTIRNTGNPERKEQLTQKLTRTQNLILEQEQTYTRFGEGKHYQMALTPNTEKLLNQLIEDGCEPFLVGGCVRDELLGLDNKDVDVEVYGADAEQIATSLRKIGRVDEVGKAFGVLKVQLDGEEFDVALPRRDSLVGDGHKGFDVEVDPAMTLEEATGRRDYTINALMYSHKHGYIIDKHAGLKDLENKQLKHVTDAFDEDPLRVLRGVQMASRFGFTLHPDTVTKSQTLADQYKSLSVERVQIEFQKLYEKGKAAQEGLKILKDTGWDKNFPGLAPVNTPELWDKVANMQKMIAGGEIPKDKRDMFLSAAVAKSIPDEKTRFAFLSETCVGDKTKNQANALTVVTPPAEVTNESMKHWAKSLPGGLTVKDWVLLNRSQNVDVSSVETVSKHAGVFDKIEPDYVSGNDILETAGKPSGRWVGDVVRELRNAQYADKFSDKTSGLNWLKKSGLLDD